MTALQNPPGPTTTMGTATAAIHVRRVGPVDDRAVLPWLLS